MSAQTRAVIAWVIGLVLIVASAFCTVHISGVGTLDIPISAQSLAVLVVSMALHHRWLGFWCVFAYVGLGVIGLPVFADGAGGLEVIRGKSGGFIWGFIAAAWAMSRSGQRHGSERFGRAFWAMVIGTCIILAMGFLQLQNQIGGEKAFIYGIRPFLPGAAIKIVLGALLVRWLTPLIDRFLDVSPLEIPIRDAKENADVDRTDNH